MLHETTEDGLPRFPTQAALAEYLQLGKQYVNQILNIQSSGVGGIGADIIEHLMHRVGLTPDWFFGEFAEGEDRPSYRDYLASTKRIARKVQTIERSQVATNAQVAELSERLAELEELLAGAKSHRRTKPAR